MNRKEKEDNYLNEEIKNIIKDKNILNIKYSNYFHLTEKSTFSEHKNFICSYIIQNNLTYNLYLSLKNNSSGEGYIFDKTNNIFIKAHSQMISKLLIDYNHNNLISCSYDKYIKIWDIQKMQKDCISQLKGHKGRIYDMDLIIDKNKLISCGMDKNIFIWDLNKFILIKNITFASCFHNLIIKYLPYINNKYNDNLNEIILLYSKNGNINIIDMNKGIILDSINIYIKEGPLLFINNQELLYQNKKDMRIIVYDFINKKEVGNSCICNNVILLWHKSNKVNKIISYDNGNNIRIWNISKHFCELCIKIDYFLYCLYVDNEGKLYCGSLNKTLIYN